MSAGAIGSSYGTPVVTINTKHDRAGRLELDGEQLVVNGRPTGYVRGVRREAERVTGSCGRRWWPAVWLSWPSGSRCDH